MSKTEIAAQWAVIVIGIVALFAALKYGQEIFAPIVLALVAGIILSPVTDVLDRVGLPHAMAAMSSFLVGVVAVVGIVLLAQPVVQRGVDAFPEVWKEMNSALYSVRGELQGLKRISENVNAALDTPGPGTQTPAEQSGDPEVTEGAVVTTEQEQTLPTVEDVIWMAPGIAAQVLIFVGALFFFILTRQEIYSWAAKRLVPPDRRIEVAMRLKAAERQVSKYFVTISVINLGLGAAVGAAMAAIGLPAPLIWGGLAFFLNYFMYVGPTLLIGTLIVAGITVFDGTFAMAPALIYLSLNFIEAQFVTPTLVGKRLSVNPLLVFLALVFFMWIWGPIGAIIAIPLLVWIIVLTTDIRELRRAERETLEDAERAIAEAG